MASRRGFFRNLLLGAALAGTASVASARVPSTPAGSGSSAPDETETSDDITLPPETPTHGYQTLAAGVLELAAGTLWYLADDRNVLDWDRPSLRSRLTGASWRYDNNTFWMNFAGHPAFGSGIYAAARAGHGGILFSFLATLSTSMAWEFGIEYNERVSINDVIFTPITGLALGEFAHKLGFYLSHPRTRSAGRTALSWALTPLTPLAQLTCAGEPTRSSPTDSLGYSSGLWHEFYADYGLFSVRALGAPEAVLLQRLRLGGRFSGLSNYRKPGRAARSFWHGEFSRLELSLEKSSEGVGVSVLTDTTLAGYAHRALTRDGVGHAHALGVAVGYGYDNSRAAGLDERKSWAGFPGLALESYWSNRTLSSELSLRAYPVFGGASAPAFPRYREQNPRQTFKTVLSREGYFYGFGWVGSVHARQRFGILSNELSLRAEPLWSSQGLDRDQAKVTDDARARDVLLELSGRVSLSLGRSLVFGIEASSRTRESRVGAVRASLSRRSLGLFLGSRL